MYNIYLYFKFTRCSKGTPVIIYEDNAILNPQSLFRAGFINLLIVAAT